MDVKAMSTAASVLSARVGAGARTAFVAYGRSSRLVAACCVLAALVATWMLNVGAGGAHSGLAHLFHVPIILAAARFTWRGAVVTALSAALLAGPALPSDIAGAVPQPFEVWGARAAVFVVLSLFAVWVIRAGSEGMRRDLEEDTFANRWALALARREIEVFYQPIVNLSSHSIVGVEAFARWNHPRHGLLGPAHFVPMAERTGLISSLDHYILHTATQQASLWTEEFGSLTLAVNVSATRFSQQDLVSDIETALTHSGLKASNLQIEITESALIVDMDNARAQIAQIRGMGAQVAVDDFGVGLASISYLNDFEVDIVKLDRSLTAKIVSQTRTAQLVSGLIGIFQTLGLVVVAEGVEEAAQYQHLRGFGCDLAQGYLLGRPASAADTGAVLRAGSGVELGIALMPVTGASAVDQQPRAGRTLKP